MTDTPAYHPDRLYTAAEVGDLQASEAELVSGPLHRRITGLEKETARLRDVNARLGARLNNVRDYIECAEEFFNEVDVNEILHILDDTTPTPATPPAEETEE